MIDEYWATTISKLDKYTQYVYTWTGIQWSTPTAFIDQTNRVVGSLVQVYLLYLWLISHLPTIFAKLTGDE